MRKIKSDVLEKLVLRGYSTNEISKELKVPQSTIMDNLRKYGLKTKWKGDLLRNNKTDEEILCIANTAMNFTDFLRKMGFKNGGGVFNHFKKRLIRLNFDFSKFQKYKKLNTKAEKIINRNIYDTKISLITTTERVRRPRLLSLMKQSNIEYQCSDCGVVKWKNCDLLLEIHHKDHNNRNNRIENLCFLCPNCHSIKHQKETI